MKDVMIDENKALTMALKEVSRIGELSNVKLDILTEETLNFEFGWMFFYQSKEYIETGIPGKMIGGNAPIIVDKYNGSVHVTGTGKDENFYIDLYCKHRENVELFNRLIME